MRGRLGKAGGTKNEVVGGGVDEEGACDSEISIVRGPLCVLCEVYFGGAGGS